MYARERVKPKLFDVDQDKIARLYADLRRESLATGSFPITVRHLESMIRMAEASARMALREYVRADDIDLAISVAIGSFVSAQKMSIKKTLERVSATLSCVLVTGLTTLVGLPQVSHPGAGPRGAAFLRPRSDCKREGSAIPASEASAARVHLDQDLGARRAGERLPY
jgi:hypothetical protein